MDPFNGGENTYLYIENVGVTNESFTDKRSRYTIGSIVLMLVRTSDWYRVQIVVCGVICKEVVMVCSCRFKQCVMTWIVVSVVAVPFHAAAQQQTTPWGDPDLQGIWTNFDLGEGFSLEAPPPPGVRAARLLGGTGTCVSSSAPLPQAEAAGVGPPEHWFETSTDVQSVRPSLIAEPANGRLPALTEEGNARIDGICPKVMDSYAYMDPWVRCITRGVPGSTFPSLYNNAYQILQVPGYVIIRYEMIHDVRVIPLHEGRASQAGLRHWMGNSHGRWEGDTLVVETKDFTGKSAIRGHAHSDQLTVTERFTPVGRNALDYEAVVNDPATWVTPWTAGIGLTRNDEYTMFEYACHEGNSTAIVNMLSGARSEER